MRRLVSDLLDAVRIQAGHLSLDLEPVPIGAIVEQAREMCRPMALERGLQFEVRATDPSMTVHVDRARIQQVLGNLLGNATKFTPNGGRVVLEARAEKGGVAFRVADTGIGIPEERLPHVFDRFWQGEQSDRRGVGLGLAITKAIVEAHGGSIEVQSTVGRGSVFTLHLPLGTAPQADASWPVAADWATAASAQPAVAVAESGPSS
jgi:signal transduction histidine kinase